MNKNMHKFTIASVAIAALVLAATAPVSLAGNWNDNELEEKIVALKDARLKIEMNATDGDAGIHVYADGDTWKSIDIYDPLGSMIFRATMRGRFAKQGGTELFIESAEPNFSQLTLVDFLKRFPEGQYQFKGKGTEGETLVGTATLTHNLPAGPELVSPLEGGALVDLNNAVVTWKPVGPANGSPIVGYQVAVVQSPSTIPAIPKIVLDVVLPATATSMIVPSVFLRPNTQYSWQVLAIEASGNQTLSSSFFQTAP